MWRKSCQHETVILWECDAKFLIHSLLLIPSHPIMTHLCSVATALSAPLPFLHASGVSETTTAWTIMRFIFGCFLCTALPKVWGRAAICQNTQGPIFSKIPPQCKLLSPEDFFWFRPCQGDPQHSAVFGLPADFAMPIMTDHKAFHCGLGFTERNPSSLHQKPTNSMALSFILEFKQMCRCPSSPGVVSSVPILSDGMRKRSCRSNTICSWSWEAAFWQMVESSRKVGSFPPSI